MYLELAEGNHEYLQQSNQDYLQQGNIYPDNAMEYYVMVPNDDGGWEYVREDKLDGLPDSIWEEVIASQPFMSEDHYLAGKAERKARRAARQMRKQQRHAIKMAKQASGEETGFQKLFSKAVGGATSIFGKGQQDPSVVQTAGGAKGFEIQAGYSDPATGILKSPVILVGGIVILTGIAIAIAARKKKA